MTPESCSFVSLAVAIELSLHHSILTYTSTVEVSVGIYKQLVLVLGYDATNHR